jgi:hypothetical protein
MVGTHIYPPLGNLIAEVVNHATQWLSQVTPPF